MSELKRAAAPRAGTRQRGRGQHGLGRGLDALMSSSGGGATAEIPLGEIDASDDQPRTQFSDASLEELAASIGEHGVLQPIVVERAGKRYRIIAGERRFRAASRAGLGSIPAVVRNTSAGDRLTLALVENLQREDLTPIEEASAFRRLLELSGMSQEQLATRVGKHPSTVANTLRLLGLPLDMQAALAEGAISAGHARALLSVPSAADRQRLFAKLEGFSVREAEAYASRLRDEANSDSDGGDAARNGQPQAKSKASRQRDPHLAEAEQALMDRLGTKVAIKGTSTAGRIEISYYSPADLQRVSDAIV